MTHIVIEFDTDRTVDDLWWADFKDHILDAICESIPPWNLSFTHGSGNRAQDEELRKAEKASEVLGDILELLKTVEPARRDSILKVLAHTKGE